MPLIYFASIGSGIPFQQANLPLGMQTALFSLCSTAAAILVIYLIVIRFPMLTRQFAQAMRDVMSAITGHRREARLNKVVCYHCNKGMGLYNPSYFLFQGEPHIEGTCSLCGGYVRVRLN